MFYVVWQSFAAFVCTVLVGTFSQPFRKPVLYRMCGNEWFLPCAQLLSNLVPAVVAAAAGGRFRRRSRNRSSFAVILVSSPEMPRKPGGGVYLCVRTSVGISSQPCVLYILFHVRHFCSSFSPHTRMRTTSQGATTASLDRLR